MTESRFCALMINLIKLFEATLKFLSLLLSSLVRIVFWSTNTNLMFCDLLFQCPPKMVTIGVHGLLGDSLFRFGSNSIQSSVKSHVPRVSLDIQYDTIGNSKEEAAALVFVPLANLFAMITMNESINKLIISADLPPAPVDKFKVICTDSCLHDAFASCAKAFQANALEQAVQWLNGKLNMKNVSFTFHIVHELS